MNRYCLLRTRSARLPLASFAIALLMFCNGCGSKSTPADAKSDSDGAASADSITTDDPESFEQASFESATYEASAQDLLDARLSPQRAAEGWVRLFDGHTFFGWEISSRANFRIEGNSIVVDEGKPCLMCTSTTWDDFVLTVQFKADQGTNSGIFVRTPLDPDDPAVDCYEINIAPDDHPFPTGSIVGRQKVDVESAGPQKPGQWRTIEVTVKGQNVSVTLDGATVCEFDDPIDLPARRIGLQHNSGRIMFRDVQIRPLGLEPMIDAELSQWKQYPDMDAEFTGTDNQQLHVVGGSGQLETKASYGDFTLLTEYKIDQPDMNSGIFFRSIPGDTMMGYECQINNDFENESRLSPRDCGTGGIFRRQDARIVAGENGRWSTVMLHANGPKIAAWVEGIQVSDWEDTRKPHQNPRKGKRIDPGTVIIQGHDPGTDVLYRKMRIVAID